MLIHHSQHRFNGWAGLYGVLGVLMIVFALIVAWFLFEREVNHQKTALAQLASKTASAIDHEMSMRAYSVIAMQKTAESLLEKHGNDTHALVNDIQAVPSKNGYTLAQLPHYQTGELGRISGLGAVPKVGSPTAQEIRMAVSLNPLFQSMVERDNETPWVYYISANRFIYLYPQVAITDYFFDESALKRDYYQLALPDNNPHRAVYWTPAYLDDGGKGLMVTVGAPVYHHDTFKGSLCIDVAIAKLSWLLNNHDTPNVQMKLYDNQAKLLSQSPAKPLTASPWGELAAKKVSLKTVPWQLEVTVSSQQMMWRAFKQAAPIVLVMLLLVVCVGLILMLLKSLKQVHTLSIIDGLTGIYNRRYFDTIVEDYLARVRRQGDYVGLVLLDIDHFKDYNDHYGHPAGDQVLIEIAKALQAQLKRPSDGVFRVGGEEFALLTEAQSPEKIMAMVNHVHQTIVQRALRFANSPMKIVTASFGVAVVPPDASLDFNAIYTAADQALYRAKQGGRNRVEIA